MSESHGPLKRRLSLPRTPWPNGFGCPAVPVSLSIQAAEVVGDSRGLPRRWRPKLRTQLQAIGVTPSREPGATRMAEGVCVCVCVCVCVYVCRGRRGFGSKRKSILLRSKSFCLVSVSVCLSCLLPLKRCEPVQAISISPPLSFYHMRIHSCNDDHHHGPLAHPFASKPP
jgi:hypothetical protein